MKHFYILANPEYFKKTMNWDMKHEDVKFTEDKLVAFIASENVPVTNIIEPYHCGYWDTDIETDLKSIYESYYGVNEEIENKNYEEEN